MQTGTCEKKDHDVLIHTLPQIEVVQSEPRDTEDDTDIPCDSTGAFHCPERDTCCKISATEWACCPSPRVRPRYLTPALHVGSLSCTNAWFSDDVRNGSSSGMWIMWPVNMMSHDPNISALLNTVCDTEVTCTVLFCYYFTRLQGNLGYCFE